MALEVNLRKSGVPTANPVKFAERTPLPPRQLLSVINDEDHFDIVGLVLLNMVYGIRWV